MEVRERTAPAPARSRPWQVVAGAALLVALAALVAILLTRGGGGGGAAAADEPAAAQTSAAADETIAPLPPTPTPTGPTEDVDEPPPSLPEVALDAPAAVGNGVVATVASVEAIEGTGVGPGNIAGPALRVTVRIENGTPEAVSLDGVAVNLAYGDDRTPASPLDDPSRRPFTGMVEPGGSGEGVYVFSVPTDVRELVTVEVGYQAGAPLLLFTGSAA
ncbi:hypothetical protein E9549_16595 [Blastococcus sp. MG754426]|uniref:hypothetical protein n=1 Tax=unclassified Blastococcus TaxID=2619396 RepID=UPI001EEFDC7A|nr:MULTISPECIES: hypothetical protein [unclassified Blastococcus]MCF6509013.1 hypothetical protein [Blastococcus sp. MG754426]MCF6513600.1 hypothetical protein [Blastococcus sp. MG754427]MCF6734596.1 hypothetical protein [Blastococcus sp. KM273129]